MRRLWFHYFLIIVLLILILKYGNNANGLPFNTIVPNHTTGWFHKAGPTESLLFGLIVLKVMALRMAGVFPYNLNKLLAEGSYIDRHLKAWGRRKSSRRTERDLNFIEDPMQQELEVLERILLGLRRIDSHDCFIRHLCNTNQKKISTNATSAYEDHTLNIFNVNQNRKSGAWDLFREALLPEPMNCEEKYPLCPLRENDFSVSSILNGIF